ncbi:MAG: glycosyltransferase family 4 protein [Bacteroidetes bacterium]|nr:glycosyltransferase family 4 protein [Bacteroidota bacterium]
MNHPRKQLLFVTDGIFPHAIGGMQRHSALLIEALSHYKEFDITVVHPHDKQVFDPSLGIKEIKIPFDFNGFYIRRCYDYSKLTHQIIQQYPDALVYAQGFSVLHGLPETGKRVIINQHGLEPYQSLTFKEKLKTMPMRFMERYQFRHAAKVVSLGGKLTHILEKEVSKPKNKIVVLPNAVNPGEKPARNFAKDKLQLLFVGRFAFNKGINILMEAVQQLNNEGYKNRLIFNLVGKGPLYEQYIKDYRFDNVNFIGFADDAHLTELYKQNDLFVFPTRFEGMPTVVLEAMAAGMPIIVSDTGATAELVSSDNGYLIETNNVRALKWAIQCFYQLNPDERMALSERSYKKVTEKFTWQKVAKMHVDLFHTFG